MSQKTVSECVFEKFCSERDIPYRAIPRSPKPTNDYDMFPQSNKIVCEIKQIDRNGDELAWERGKVDRLNAWPGNRVRDRINDAAGQLKVGSSGKFPSLLVVYNNVPYRSYANASDVLTAMYGQETAVINVPDDPQSEPYLQDVIFGAKRCMTPQHKTSIGALAVMREDGGAINLFVYHNVHAAIPLDPNLLRYPGIRHFTVDLQPDNTYSEWREI